jgi:hypothetical protein
MIPVEMVFNELSLRSPFGSKHDARRQMTEFIDTMRTSTSHGVKRRLCTVSNFDFLMLSDDYLIVQWRNDPEVEREERSFLRTLQNRGDSPLPDVADSSVEANYSGIRSIGLEYAVVFEELAISLQSEDIWNRDRLTMSVTTIDDGGAFSESQVDLYHASSSHHVLQHVKWISERNRININSGSDLLERCDELIPHLMLCDSAAKQLDALRKGDLMLRPVIKRLLEMESYCRSWQNVPFSPDDFPSMTTPESDATLQQYSSERTFTCPDGQVRVFSWHVRLTPLSWRIYFVPEEPLSLGQSGGLIIGYLGPHLRTVNFR